VIPCGQEERVEVYEAGGVMDTNHLDITQKQGVPDDSFWGTRVLQSYILPKMSLLLQ
jgi:hypothetical protein